MHQILILLMGLVMLVGCGATPTLYPKIGPTCRHTVVSDVLFIGEYYKVYQIAVDPTISKHAQVRYFTEGEWHWYCSTQAGWIPEDFNPVLFFSLEKYLEWYIAIFHLKGGVCDG